MQNLEVSSHSSFFGSSFSLEVSPEKAFEKNSFFLIWSGIMVLSPGYQFAGQTSPFLSANWNP
jgi:hypothetical protein